MQPYIFFSFIAAVGFAFSGVVNKFISKHAIKERWPFLFYYYLTFFPFVLIIPFIAKLQTPAGNWSNLFLYSLFFFLGNICFFTAVFKIDASVLAPFFQLQSAFIAILAFLFLGERFPLLNYMWIGLILIGAVLVSLDERMHIKTFFQRAIFLIIFMQIFYAISNLYAGFALKAMDFWNLTFWTTLISAFIVLAIVPSLAKFKLKASFKQVKPVILSNFFSFIAVISLFAAFQTNLTISSAISLLSSPIILGITILASRFRPELLEHHTSRVYLVRGIGVLLILFGAMRISLSG